jgi:hypothetical protein
MDIAMVIAIEVSPQHYHAMFVDPDGDMLFFNAKYRTSLSPWMVHMLLEKLYLPSTIKRRVDKGALRFKKLLSIEVTRSARRVQRAIRGWLTRVRAARIIQRQYLLAYYDPVLLLCRRRISRWS